MELKVPYNVQLKKYCKTIRDYKQIKICFKRNNINDISRFEEGVFRKRVQIMYGVKLQKVEFTCKEKSLEAILDRLPTAVTASEEMGEYTIKTEVFGKGIDMCLKSQNVNITKE